MREVRIKSSKSYSNYITSGYSGLNILFETHKVKRCFIITDEMVFNSYKNFFEIFKGRLAGIKVFKSQEVNSSFDALISIYEEFTKSDLNHRTHVVVVGGVVLSNLAGFATATFMRGVPFISVPTTLLGQCRNSIEGENGFYFKGTQNIIGTFYKPEFVYSNVNFIKTLKDKEYKSGLAEVLKYGIVYDPNLFHFLEENRKGIYEREVDKLLHIVNECTKINANITDKHEDSSDMVNYLGFSRILEQAIDDSLDCNFSYGENSAMGMKMAALISYKSGYLDRECCNRIINLLNDFGFSLNLKDSNIRKIVGFINKYKKDNANNVKFILPDKIGHAIITTEIKQNIILNAVDELIGRKL